MCSRELTIDFRNFSDQMEPFADLVQQKSTFEMVGKMS